MARWRDTKKGKINNSKKDELSIEESFNYAPTASRIKAFITDTFLITTPIVYVTIYLIMGSGDDFSHNRELGWLIILIVHFITIMGFWLVKGQTPGLKAYEGKIVDNKTKGKISYIQALVRYVATLICVISIFGMFLPFLRKDKKTLQDLLSNSCVLNEPSE